MANNNLSAVTNYSQNLSVSSTVPPNNLSVQKNPRGLGRGLDAMLGAPAGEQKKIPLVQITPGKFQPRSHFEQTALQELADSIKQHGVMQPILLRKLGVGNYEIIAGERRFQASQLAGLSEIPALIKDVDDQTAAVYALLENMQREDLNPIEEARGMVRLVEEFKLTHEQVAETLGKSRSVVTNTMRLTNLAEQVQGWLIRGELEMGHARSLLTLPAVEQVMLAQKIIQNKWTVRQSEIEVKMKKLEFEAAAIKATPGQHVSPPFQFVDGAKKRSTVFDFGGGQASLGVAEWEALQEKLSDQLAVNVTLSPKKSGVVFSAHFADRAALENFVGRLLTDEE